MGSRRLFFLKPPEVLVLSFLLSLVLSLASFLTGRGEARGFALSEARESSPRTAESRKSPTPLLVKSPLYALPLHFFLFGWMTTRPGASVLGIASSKESRVMVALTPTNDVCLNRLMMLDSTSHCSKVTSLWNTRTEHSLCLRQCALNSPLSVTLWIMGLVARTAKSTNVEGVMCQAERNENERGDCRLATVKKNGSGSPSLAYDLKNRCTVVFPLGSRPWQSSATVVMPWESKSGIASSKVGSIGSVSPAHCTKKGSPEKKT
mmetsp:Transcript_64561/g.152708  ORF Transcript_64561/g.152708 Transcript_64561/m.152708 type:complete len:263 (-) Transcript_64561:445-1233(-)